MKKIDSIVVKETFYIAAFTLILSALMESIFLVLGKWDFTVLLGNALGFVAAVGNFLLLGITVQNAVLKEEKDAKYLMKLSQTARLFLMFLIAVIGYLIPVFNLLAVIITYIFPRIAIAVRPAFNKKG